MTTATLARVRLDVWRTTLSLTARSDDPRAPLHLDRLLHDAVARLDSAANRFHETSEISQVNRRAGSWVDVSWHFVDILTAALDAATESDGLVDPCLGRAVDAAGYRTWRDGVAPPTLPAPDGTSAPATQPMSHPAWRDVEVRPAGSHARVRIPAGVALDLGAIGKAWLADRLAHRAAEELETDVIADMGGDLSVVGTWVVAADPALPEHPAQALEVSDCGLATSGTGRRTWRLADGRRVSHVIDPSTGQPADLVWHTVSVLARDARGANIAATSAVVLGTDAGPWLADRGLDAWLVATDGTEVRVGRWPGREES
ncbi:MAG: FAD:protein FMN transferase [Candidatus Nanopelagicales bacterium]